MPGNRKRDLDRTATRFGSGDRRNILSRTPLFAFALLPLLITQPAFAEGGVGAGLVHLAPQAQGSPQGAPSGSGSAAAVTLPSGGTIVSGAAIVTASGTSLTIDQSTAKAIIDWSSFSIGQKGAVQFNNGSGATLNRVTGTTVSSIDGLLSATGSVYLINPNGVIVGKTGVVNTGGSFAASTLDVDDTAFTAGSALTFAGPSTAKVMNLGKIGSLGGDVVLVAATVSNQGSIAAPKGSVGLIAGQAVLIRDQALSDGKFAVLLGGAGTSATNAGVIDAANAELRAEGGNVYALAGATGGVIRATGVSAQDGKVWLVAQGGTVSVAGSISAHGAGGSAGYVETSGDVMNLGRATVDAGKGGTWLVDPFNLKINQIAATSIAASLNAGTNVTQQTTGSAPGAAGDIVINPNVTINWSTAASLTLSSFHDIIFGAGAKVKSTGGGAVTLSADNTAIGSGTVTFGASSGVSTSGAVDIFYNPVSYTDAATSSSVTGGSPYAAFTSGGATLGAYMLINSTSALVYSQIVTDGVFALGRDLDFSGIDPGGSALYNYQFTGVLNGQNHRIDHLTFSLGYSNDFGLFAHNSGLIENLNITNEMILKLGGAGTTAGLLAAVNDGRIVNVSVSGSITGSDFTTVGGLVGLQTGSGSITGSHANSQIAMGSAGAGGGLVGSNSGAISTSYATGALSNDSRPGAGSVALGGLVGYHQASGTVTDSFASGSVSATAAADGSDIHLGGFAGVDAGSIRFSYATGGVHMTIAAGAYDGSDVLDAGAFAGAESATGSIASSYATGLVDIQDNAPSASPMTGFVGTGHGAISNTYYDTTTTGLATGVTAGATGLTTAQFGDMTNFSGLTFSTTPGALGKWVIVDADGTLNNANGATGATRPMLTGEYSHSITSAHQLQLVAMDLAGHYTLGGDIDAGATRPNSGADVWIGDIGFIPLGNDAPAFTGSLDGLGHIIDGLNIDNFALNNVGLFGTVRGGSISNLSLTNALVIGSNNVGALAGSDYGPVNNVHISGAISLGAAPADTSIITYIGGLVGLLNGSMINSSSDATVDGLNGTPSNAGGLVGGNSGFIGSSHSSGSVSGFQFVGGLAGINVGIISTSYATGLTNGIISPGGLSGINAGFINNSWASGDVNGYFFAGGLTGANVGSISYAYATGAARSQYSGGGAGGLTGLNAGAVSNTYATGPVSAGGGAIGGLVGVENPGSTVANSYWDSVTTGQTVAGSTTNGMTGVSSVGGAGVDPFSTTNYGGFTFTATPGTLNAWVIVDQDGTLNGAHGATRPMLATEYATSIINAHQLQLVAMDRSASYTLANDIDASGTALASSIWGGAASSGFVPLYFNGMFDGQNHSVNGLTVNRPGRSAALFFIVSQKASVQNLTLLNAAITGGQFSAGIAGQNFGVIRNVTVSGGSVTGADYTGGIAGSNRNLIIRSSNNGMVVTGTNDVGGVAGLNTATISNVATSGAVSGSLRIGGVAGSEKAGSIVRSSSSGAVNGGSYVGGLVGEVYGGAVTGSSSYGSVTAIGDYAGGVAGANFGSISESYSGSIVGGSSYVGGLAGLNGSSGSIAFSATSSQTVNGVNGVGGLIGWNVGNLTQSGVGLAFNGHVTGTGDMSGGLVGWNTGSIMDQAQTSGAVYGNHYVGGLIGRNDASAGAITNASSSGLVSGVSVVGGLIGSNRGVVTGSSSSSIVTATGAYAGGLIGTNTGALTNDTATGDVSGSDFVGGLVGSNTGTVANSTASGTVTSPGHHKGPKYGRAGGAN